MAQKMFYFERIIITGRDENKTYAVIGTSRSTTASALDGITFQSKRKIGAWMLAINLMTWS